MNLPSPTPSYDPGNEANARREIEREDKQNIKRGQDVEFDGKTRFIIRSPNGHRWTPSIDNAGAVTWTDLDV